MTTAWILCVLVAVNAVVFFSFMKITINMEDQELYQRANSLIKDMKLDHSSVLIKEQLTPYLTGHSFIRMVQPGSKKTTEVTNDKPMAAKIKPKFV